MVECGECGTVLYPHTETCPNCGTTGHLYPREENMPKITKGLGPTTEADYERRLDAPAGAEVPLEGGGVWPGNSSSTSPAKPQTNDETSDPEFRQPAPNAENPSDEDHEENSSTVPSTGGSTPETTSPAPSEVPPKNASAATWREFAAKNGYEGDTDSASRDDLVTWWESRA